MEVNSMAAILTTAVLAFLAGTITGIVGMYCADSKYIKIIQEAYKEKIRIHRRTKREADNETL